MQKRIIQIKASDAVLITGVATAIGAILLVCFQLFVSRNEALEREAVNLSTHALMLSESVLQMTRASEAVLKETVEDVYRRTPTTKKDYQLAFSDEQTFRRLEARAQSLPSIDVVTIVDVEGNVVNFSRSYPPPSINLADRDYFIAHRSGDGIAREISAPVQNRGTGTWVFYQSKPIFGPEQEFFGLVLTGLSQKYFNTLFNFSNNDPNTKFSLIRADGVFVAGDPALQDFVKSKDWQLQNDKLHLNPPKIELSSGRFQYDGFLVAYQNLTDKPLTIIAIKKIDSVLKEWRTQVLVSLTIVFLISTILIWASFENFRSLRKQERLIVDLDEAKTAAQKASSSKSTFLAHMSHELRTPLNAIIGFGEIISSEQLGKIEQRKYVEYASDINVAGNHLLQLINEILDFSKIESGKLTLSEDSIDICGLIERCLRLLEPKAISSDVRLVAFGLSEVIEVKCDELRMRQILLNLLTNAVKYTPRGGRVAIRIARMDENLNIEIEDTGVGMKPSEIDAAVQPFVQLNASPTQKSEGTGLGLPIAKRLIELHGGRLDIQSQYGSGTVATIRIPISRLEQ
jgi:signal transduction histidine kinase